MMCKCHINWHPSIHFTGGHYYFRIRVTAVQRRVDADVGGGGGGVVTTTAATVAATATTATTAQWHRHGEDVDVPSKLNTLVTVPPAVAHHMTDTLRGFHLNNRDSCTRQHSLLVVFFVVFAADSADMFEASHGADGTRLADSAYDRTITVALGPADSLRNWELCEAVADLTRVASMRHSSRPSVVAASAAAAAADDGGGDGDGGGGCATLRRVLLTISRTYILPLHISLALLPISFASCHTYSPYSRPRYLTSLFVICVATIWQRFHLSTGNYGLTFEINYILQLVQTCASCAHLYIDMHVSMSTS